MGGMAGEITGAGRLRDTKVVVVVDIVRRSDATQVSSKAGARCQVLESSILGPKGAGIQWNMAKGVAREAEEWWVVGGRRVVG